MAKAGSLAAVVVLSGCVITLFLRRELFGTGPATIALQIGAFVLMIWARLTFGVRSFHATANATRGGLVTTGPYRYIRHPIYAAVLLFVWAGVIAHPVVVAALIAIVVTGVSIVRMLLEERELVQMYPEYRDYSARTMRVIPRVV